MKRQSIKSQSIVTVTIALVGDGGVGKTSLLVRFCEDIMPEYAITITIDSKYRILNIAGVTVRVQVLDTIGAERFTQIEAPEYIYRAQGVILVYDVADEHSFQQVEYWLNDVNRTRGGRSILLVGNKSDLANRQVSYEKGKELASVLKVEFLETSAMDASNVECAFVSLIYDIVKKREGDVR